MDAGTLALLLSLLRLTTPLCIAAMGELVAERAGVLNIGIEGMMLVGALVAFAVGVSTGSGLLAVLGGISAGAALAALFAAFVLWRGADPIVCGAALNLFALGATGTFYRMLFPPELGHAAAPQPGALVFVVLTGLLVLGVGLFLTRTRLGLALRAVGERADAAHAQGVRVLRIRWA
ncbi:MAG: ABC transporter permease, partial [Deltaproteobacteria bacterium]|nr:ABC transporter permease [Deltaproteobacteria bacterium]